MKTFKKIAGITWAILGVLLIIVLFPGLTGFSRSLAGMPFMKINPNYSGGEEVFREISPACTLVVHRPVFDGLTGERKKGFVQIDWRGKLPEIISDTIDYDRNNIPDFIVNINTRENISKLFPSVKNVMGLNISTPASYGWTVRVGLRRNEQ